MADMHDRLRSMTIRNLKPRSQGGKGMEGTLKRATSVYNPTTDMNEQVIEEFDISGLRATYKIYHIDGQLIRQGDLKFYLCPILTDGTDCPAPQTTDKLLFDRLEYMIVTVKPWRFAGTDCGWLLQLRGS